MAAIWSSRGSRTARQRERVGSGVKLERAAGSVGIAYVTG
jgi:hypothetical protein